jgi:hypothetical protein
MIAQCAAPVEGEAADQVKRALTVKEKHIGDRIPGIGVVRDIRALVGDSASAELYGSGQRLRK